MPERTFDTFADVSARDDDAAFVADSAPSIHTGLVPDDKNLNPQTGRWIFNLDSIPHYARILHAELELTPSATRPNPVSGLNVSLGWADGRWNRARESGTLIHAPNRAAPIHRIYASGGDIIADGREPASPPPSVAGWSLAGIFNADTDATFNFRSDNVGAGIDAFGGIFTHRLNFTGPVRELDRIEIFLEGVDFIGEMSNATGGIYLELYRLRDSDLKREAYYRPTDDFSPGGDGDTVIPTLLDELTFLGRSNTVTTASLAGVTPRFEPFDFSSAGIQLQWEQRYFWIVKYEGDLEDDLGQHVNTGIVFHQYNLVFDTSIGNDTTLYVMNEDLNPGGDHFNRLIQPWGRTAKVYNPPTQGTQDPAIDTFFLPASELPSAVLDVTQFWGPDAGSDIVTNKFTDFVQATVNEREFGSDLRGTGLELQIATADDADESVSYHSLQSGLTLMRWAKLKVCYELWDSNKYDRDPTATELCWVGGVLDVAQLDPAEVEHDPACIAGDPGLAVASWTLGDPGTTPGTWANQNPSPVAGNWTNENENPTAGTWTPLHVPDCEEL